MLRRTVLAGAGSLLFVPARAFALDPLPTVWTGGGTNPLYPVPDRHRVALRRYVEMGFFTEDEARKLLSEVESGRRNYSQEPIEEGMQFDAMGFGGGKGRPIEFHRNVIAAPSKWTNVSCTTQDEKCTMKAWFLDPKTARTDRPSTIAYCDPLVCGNSSVIEWRAGKPVCVPLPARGRYI